MNLCPVFFPHPLPPLPLRRNCVAGRGERPALSPAGAAEQRCYERHPCSAEEGVGVEGEKVHNTL